MNTRIKVGIEVWFKPCGKGNGYHRETATVIESFGDGWFKLQKKEGTYVSIHRAHLMIA